MQRPVLNTMKKYFMFIFLPWALACGAHSATQGNLIRNIPVSTALGYAAGSALSAHKVGSTVGEIAYIQSPHQDWTVYLLLVLLTFYSIRRNYLGRIERRLFMRRLQFFANTAHDMRTQLTLIVNPLSDLDDENGLSLEERRKLSPALVGARNLYQLTTELLDFQKIDFRTSGSRKKRTGHCDLKVRLSEIVAHCAPLFHEKDIHQRLILPKEEVTVGMNRNEIDHVLYNVISNAVKYNRQGGKVTIELQQDKHHTTVAVSDTGIGIPQKSQKRVFTLFYRAANATGDNPGGNGLGLAFAREIMRMHQGDITFNSTEGKGTTFFITFSRKQRHWKLLRLLSPLRAHIRHQRPRMSGPIAHRLQLQTTQPTVRQNEIGLEDTPHRKRLMIIEVRPLQGLLQHELLSPPQCRTLANQQLGIVVNLGRKMPDGDTALAALKQNTVDFIISDVLMPGIKGDTLCRKIKTSVETSHIPVILLTARSGRAEAMKGFDCGADDYIPKPFDSAKLKAKVRNMLNAQTRLREKAVQQYGFKHETEATDQTTDTENKPELNETDHRFLDHCLSYVMENMNKTDFSIKSLCREIAVSRTILYEKLKALTGKSPGEFITILRMRKAAELLQRGEQVQEVAVEIGLSDAKYFSTAFKKYYGISPSKFKKGA